MDKTKLTRKEIAVSILLFFVGVILLAVLIFLMLLMRKGSQVFVFLNNNIENTITVGISLVVIFALTYFYFVYENKAFIARPSKITEFFLLLYISFTICAVIGLFVDPMARPLLFFGLMVGKLFKRKDAIFLNLVFAFVMILNRYLTMMDENFIAAFIVNFQIEILIRLFTIFCGGMVAIFLIQGVKTRMGSVLVTFVLFIPVLIINVTMQLPFINADSTFKYVEIIIYSVVNCLLSVLLFMFFLPIFEVIFAELTSFRLRELTSDNAKLIRKLKENAYGTYNHSIVVAQLSEACAAAINEDSELARAAAFYHDIGKLKNPEMFTENQNEYDLHKELTPELSVDIIRSHARDGAKLIKKYHLPEFFADIAVQHHGTMPIKYFYAKALKLSDGALNPNNYSYAGPTPTTKIAAIIMICDAAEAASRSLPTRSAENVEALVKSIVEERMNMGQFVDCDITMRELTIITRTIVSSLSGVYHSRVAYPKLVLSQKKK